jgi:hypothetical protein
MASNIHRSGPRKTGQSHGRRATMSVVSRANLWKAFTLR